MHLQDAAFLPQIVTHFSHIRLGKTSTTCMRKKSSRVIVLALMCLAALQPSVALAITQSTAVVSGGVINFGAFSVLPGCVNCKVIISAAGIRSVVGAVVLSSSNTGSAATFRVTQTCNGGGCTTYSASAVATSAIAAGGVSMALGTFTFAQSTVVAKINTLSVGATLTIPSRGSGGTFSGGGFTVMTTP